MQLTCIPQKPLVPGKTVWTKQSTGGFIKCCIENNLTYQETIMNYVSGLILTGRMPSDIRNIRVSNSSSIRGGACTKHHNMSKHKGLQGNPNRDRINPCSKLFLTLSNENQVISYNYTLYIVYMPCLVCGSRRQQTKHVIME